MCNSFLHGSKTHQIDAILSLLLLGVLLAAFIGFGWKAGLVAIALAFVYGAFSRPIAARLASRLMSIGTESTGRYVGLPPRALERISQELGREIKPRDMMKEITTNAGRRERAENALLDYCISQPPIQALLQEFDGDRDTLKGIYSNLCMAGASQWAGGHWVAASALAYPDSLRFVLMNARKGATQLQEIHALIMHFERGTPLM
jgi:hypothetical protein